MKKRTICIVLTVFMAVALLGVVIVTTGVAKAGTTQVPEAFVTAPLLVDAPVPDVNPGGCSEAPRIVEGPELTVCTGWTLPPTSTVDLFLWYPDRLIDPANPVSLWGNSPMTVTYNDGTVCNGYNVWVVPGLMKLQIETGENPTLGQGGGLASDCFHVPTENTIAIQTANITEPMTLTVSTDGNEQFSTVVTGDEVVAGNFASYTEWPIVSTVLESTSATTAQTHGYAYNANPEDPPVLPGDLTVEIINPNLALGPIEDVDPSLDGGCAEAPRVGQGPQPDVCTGWNLNEPNTTYTMTLWFREDQISPDNPRALWGNGVSIDAKLHDGHICTGVGSVKANIGVTTLVVTTGPDGGYIGLGGGTGAGCDHTVEEIQQHMTAQISNVADDPIEVVLYHFDGQNEPKVLHTEVITEDSIITTTVEAHVMWDNVGVYACPAITGPAASICSPVTDTGFMLITDVKAYWLALPFILR